MTDDLTPSKENQWVSCEWAKVFLDWLTDLRGLYLDFASGAGLFTATFGEEGSSLMEEF